MIDKKNISFMRSLCMGQLEEDVLLPFPEMKEEEKAVLREVTRSIDTWLKGHEADFRHWDRKGELPAEVLEEMRQLGLFGLVIPEEFGGMGLGAMAYSRTLQQLCRYDGSISVTVGAHSSIGMRGLLLFGTPEQKKRYLPRLATGEMIAAFCLTEPGAGSDAASIRTRAVKDGDHWVLNGQKLWITNGGIADFFTVFAKTADEGKGQMTAFIVTRDMLGLSNGPHEDKMGLRASSTTTVHFDNVRVPAENVLGGVGKGFKVAMQVLNSGRIGLGGGCVGAMKRGLEICSHQVQERAQFGRPIAQFGLIKQKMGHAMVECYASESVVNMVAGLMDQGCEDYAVEAAISKVFVTECLWRSVDEAVQIAGGNGYMCEFPFERAMRDTRINRIFEGTNDILRLFIALMAMNDVGKQLEELSSSLKGLFDAPIKGFGLLSDYARKRVTYATGVGLTPKRSFTKLHPALREYGTFYEDATRELATFTDRLLRKHGRNIIEKQFATRRMADVMIDLFALACVISRVHTSIEKIGLKAAEPELQILRVFAGQVRRRTRANFGKIDQNDDELIEALADKVYRDERYVWDSI